MSTLEKERVSTNPMTVVVLPQKVWSSIIHMMHAIDEFDDEQKIQREIGAAHYLFNEWERETVNGQKIEYGENYYGWDTATLTDLKVALRNLRWSMDKLMKEEQCLPESVREEYDSIRVE